ncbi:MAG: cysteine methyltransferase [Hadesarchaea archaeon]|nr:MAG: cysteine methyltransferase [Hadesarchaea archaeon]
MGRFQFRVLKLVSEIPSGKVTTYKELARAMGNPRACRAVAGALAKNPDPVKIPCHRVVRSDGQIGGYKLGISRKAKLLTEEGVTVRNKKVDLERYMYRF